MATKKVATKRQIVFDFLLAHPALAGLSYTDLWREMSYPDISFDTIVKGQRAFTAWQSNKWCNA